MKLRLSVDLGPDERVFILQAVESGVLNPDEAHTLLFVEED